MPVGILKGLGSAFDFATGIMDRFFPKKMTEEEKTNVMAGLVPLIEGSHKLKRCSGNPSAAPKVLIILSFFKTFDLVRFLQRDNPGVDLLPRLEQFVKCFFPRSARVLGYLLQFLHQASRYLPSVGSFG